MTFNGAALIIKNNSCGYLRTHFKKNVKLDFEYHKIRKVGTRLFGVHFYETAILVLFRSDFHDYGQK